MDNAFKTHLQFALEDAQKAHHQLVNDMEQTGHDKGEIEAENSNWAIFYACYIERRMRQFFTLRPWPATRLVSPETEHMPVAHVRHTEVWDGGPSWITNNPEVQEAVSEHSRLHVG